MIHPWELELVHYAVDPQVIIWSFAFAIVFGITLGAGAYPLG